MSETERSPRLIRRGDIVKIKDSEVTDVVRGVVVVLQLANGGSDSYGLDEVVVMGTDSDPSPAELAVAAVQDATERANAAIATEQALAAAMEKINTARDEADAAQERLDALLATEKARDDETRAAIVEAAGPDVVAVGPAKS